MATRNYQMRLERVERAAKAQSKFAAECICFPENEPPFFHWLVEQKIASEVKCPIHGDRFPPQYLIYVSAWLREKREAYMRDRKSSQFKKAWLASFPNELWPAQEEKVKNGIVLILKDGTRLPI